MQALCLTLLLLTANAPLEEITALARGGAPGLALRLLDDYQQEATDAAWQEAERERIHILAARSNWETLLERSAHYPAGLSQSFLDWVEERRAEAWLHVGEPLRAREVVRNIIWATGVPDEDSLRRLRVLLIRSHLMEDDLDSALIGLRRYVQDYGHTSAAQRILHGEALLRAGRAQVAFEVLSGAEGGLAVSLRWLARLEVEPGSAGEVMEQAVRAGSARETGQIDRRVAWAVAARAAGRLANRAIQVAAMERSLLLARPTETVPLPLKIDAMQIWQTYVEWGRALGNNEQLIMGVDQDWLDAAEQRADTEGAEARALYAALADHSSSETVTDFAFYRFARSLLKEPGGERLLLELALNTGVFDAPEDLPVAVRYDLVDEVLRQGDIALASRLIADLTSPPQGVAEEDWVLRRARVLVLAGRPGDAHVALSGFLESVDDYDVDRFLQVLFDLQRTEAHAYAYDLLGAVLQREDLPPQVQREVLYWMADSQRAMGEYAQSARLYLRSATLEDAYAMDPWAQTARFQAAEVLELAGLREDAVVMLQALFSATEDAGRRAALRQKIDQLTR